MNERQREMILIVGVTSTVIAILIAAFLFEFDYETKYCNAQVCLDEVSISMISLGLISIGNPISVGIVSIS